MSGVPGRAISYRSATNIYVSGRHLAHRDTGNLTTGNQIPFSQKTILSPTSGPVPGILSILATIMTVVSMMVIVTSYCQHPVIPEHLPRTDWDTLSPEEIREAMNSAVRANKQAGS